MAERTPIEKLRSAIMTVDLSPEECCRLLELVDVVKEEIDDLCAGVESMSPEAVLAREQELLDEIERLKASSSPAVQDVLKQAKALNN